VTVVCLAQHYVAFATQDSAHLSEFVAMVNNKLAAPMIWASRLADGAAIALRFEHCLPLLKRDSIGAAQLLVLFSSLVVLSLSLCQYFCLSGPVTASRLFLGALLASSGEAVCHSLLPVKLRRVFLNAAANTQFHSKKKRQQSC
jgi:hypothetical protein